MAARVARLAMLPLEAAYAGAVFLRGALYDAGALPSHRLALPSISVGNLTVGGTGKTPVAAWMAHALCVRGAHPAIVLRGYGGDEPLVHATLNPDVPVVVSPDRVTGAERARVLGADVVVLDDAFQHRRARRDVDLVLLSTEQWTGRPRLLPAGPWREPARALRRASALLVTRKAAPPEAAQAVLEAAARIAPGVPAAAAHLVPGELRAAVGAARLSTESLRGARVLAIAAIGDPMAFVAQLRALGAEVTPVTFPDHHRYTADEARRLALDAARADLTVCTLKDAVKLAPCWPREAPPLWYVSQHVVVERGTAAIEALLHSVMRALPTRTPPAGADRPTD